MRFTRRQCFLTIGAAALHAAESPLVAQWRGIATQVDGTVGAAALNLASGQVTSLNGQQRYPLASVCKLPIAMQMLALVDEGKYTLHQAIEIPLYDVVPSISPVADRWATQKSFPLDELLELMVAKSDNTAVQTLFRLGGNAPGFAARFKKWGISGIRLDRSERQCGLDAYGVRAVPPVAQWTPSMADELTARVPEPERIAAMRRFVTDPRDTATPDGTVKLLAKAFQGKLLQPATTRRLVEILTATATGPNRIKGLLPPGTIVAHKTGTTVTIGNINGATNDAGVIRLPNGSHLALAVYIKGSTADLATREKVIAQIAKAGFEKAALDATSR